MEQVQLSQQMLIQTGLTFTMYWMKRVEQTRLIQQIQMVWLISTRQYLSM